MEQIDLDLIIFKVDRMRLSNLDFSNFFFFLTRGKGMKTAICSFNGSRQLFLYLNKSSFSLIPIIIENIYALLSSMKMNELNLVSLNILIVFLVISQIKLFDHLPLKSSSDLFICTDLCENTVSSLYLCGMLNTVSLVHRLKDHHWQEQVVQTQTNYMCMVKKKSMDLEMSKYRTIHPPLSIFSGG